MKKTIVGLEPVDYVSIKTGNQVQGFTLYLETDNVNVYGKKTSDLYISRKSKFYSQFESFVTKPLDLIGLVCVVDYDENRHLQNLELET